MLTITIRTDQPEAQIGLFENDKQLAYEAWQAHRLLAETIHHKIQALLESYDKKLQDLEAVVVFRGPGSFTGLRIGISVANALADGLRVPIVGATGDDWRENGLQKLRKGDNDQLVLPEYGSPPHVTKPKR